VNLAVRIWPDDQHWRQRMDEATTHIAGQAVRATQEDGRVRISGVIRISRPKLFMGHAEIEIRFVCDVVVATADHKRQVAGQKAHGFGSVIEPQPQVTA
jgi:hypothetical protein